MNNSKQIFHLTNVIFRYQIVKLIVYGTNSNNNKIVTVNDLVIETFPQYFVDF